MIEPYVINQEDTDVTEADGTADELQDLFSYRVPKGQKIILRPEDVLCVGIKETDNTVGQAIALVKLEWRDATATERRALVQSTQYANFSASGVGEFQDEDKLIHLDIQREMIVGEREYIVLQVKNASPYADAIASHYEIRCRREI